MNTLRYEKAKYGIYKVTDEFGVIMYVGSTSVECLDRLETNHRSARKRGYSMTKFRVELEHLNSAEWQFEWAIEPRVTIKPFIEIEEGALIRYLKPELNSTHTWGQFPYKASVDQGRYLALAC
jgi:hypothetical protein